MRAIINDNKFIYFDNLTVAEEEILWNEFSVAKPTRFVDPNQYQRWDGVYRKYNRNKKRIAYPFLNKLKQVAEKHNLPLDIVDKRNLNTEIRQIDEHFLPGITLERYQVEAVNAALSVDCGVIDIPTGGGKGELLCAIAKALDCNTVILADQTIVIDQLKKRLELREVAEEVGMFYAGKKPNGETIVVGSIQSLTVGNMAPVPPNRSKCGSDAEYEKKLKRWETAMKAAQTRVKTAKSLMKYVENANCLLVDEADKAVSDPWKNLFRFHYQGRWRFGFSGTPTDEAKPVEAMVLEEHLGPIIYRAQRKELTDLGRIVPCEYNAIVFGIDGSIQESSAYDIAYNDYMVTNNKFHGYITKLASNILAKFDKDGILILVEREELGYNILSALKAVGIESSFIFGKTPKKKRNLELKRFENREIRVLIGGKILNRGLDLKGGTEHLILAAGGKLASDFNQRVGRAVRVNKAGISKIYDFYFRCNKYLYQHSKARLKAIVGMGYKTRVIYPGGQIDGSELIRKRFIHRFRPK